MASPNIYPFMAQQGLHNPAQQTKQLQLQWDQAEGLMKGHHFTPAEDLAHEGVQKQSAQDRTKDVAP